MKGASEMMNLAIVWFAVFVSLCYCYWISKTVPKGPTRLLCVLPVVFLFFFLPLSISSVHFTGITGFFVAWLANFKLLLLAFGKGPLNSDEPVVSLGRFVALACLPIKITRHNKFSEQENSQIQSKSKTKRFDQNGENQTLPPDPGEAPKSTSKRLHQNGKNQDRHSNPSRETNGSQIETKPSSISQYAMKGVVVAILVKIYDYSDYIHPKLIMGMYCIHIYYLLELSLAVAAATARAVLGLELEPQFNEPFRSTSLQDFWGRRWNLMVTSILRPTVYEPTVNAVRRIVGPRWAPLPAVWGTFAVSAAMHELIMYYMGRMEPSFRMTWFFLLHGSCMTAEIALKKAVNSRCRLPTVVSGPMTVGFVLVTSIWLFLPEFLRCRVDVRAFDEYAALGALVKNVGHAFLGYKY